MLKTPSGSSIASNSETSGRNVTSKVIWITLRDIWKTIPDNVLTLI